MLRSRIVYGHNSFVLNEHIDANGDTVPAQADDTVVIDRRINEPLYRDTRDPLHLGQGGTLGRVHKGFAGWRFAGRLLVPDATQEARLADRERALRAAFDPAICLNDSPATEGAYALDWSDPTGDTTNFPTGLMPVRIYARPARQPEIVESVIDRSRRDVVLSFIAPDPRIYRQAESALALTPGAPSGNVINIGATAAPLKVTVAMTGAGHSAFTLTLGGVPFVLNLAGTANSDSIVVIMETCGPYGRGRYITKNGIENAALKTSSASSWRTAPVGSTAADITNTTNVASCTLAWHSAWA